MGRQHCSSLCSQSEGHGHVAKMLKFAVGSLFCGVSAIKSSPSLCEQSELQCFASDFRLFQTRVQFSLYFTPLKKVFRISFPARILQLILNTYLFAEERFRSFLFLKDPPSFFLVRPWPHPSLSRQCLSRLLFVLRPHSSALLEWQECSPPQCCPQDFLPGH